MEGIIDGTAPVIGQDFDPNDPKPAIKLCEFRVQSFTKKVAYDDYLRYKHHLYENFARAFGQKFVLTDIYDTLSPNDKKVFTAISDIILGLNTSQEKLAKPSEEAHHAH